MQRKRLIFGFSFLACVLLIGFAVLLIPRHTAPEYAAASYEELAKKVRGCCFLPEKEMLPDTGCNYYVYLKSRFSDRAVGYLLSYFPPDGCAKTVSVTCKALTERPEGYGSITPTETCGEVGLAVSKDFLCFVLDGCRYDIHGTGASEGFLQTARTLARSIIDAGAAKGGYT